MKDTGAFQQQQQHEKGTQVKPDEGTGTGDAADGQARGWASIVAQRIREGGLRGKVVVFKGLKRLLSLHVSARGRLSSHCRRVRIHHAMLHGGLMLTVLQAEGDGLHEIETYVT